jgi:biotin carboxylase
MKTLLVLAAGPLQLPAILAARRMGLRVVALDGDATAPGLALADVGRVVDILDPAACLRVAREEHADGVIHICSEVAMPALGLINEEMRLHGPDRATVLRATNKERMRRAFEAGGAPSPRSLGAATRTEALAARAAVGPACILKPSRNSGSRGVTRVGAGDGDEALLQAFDRAVRESRDATAVVETFVEGPEFSIEIVVADGQPHVLAVTDKETTGAPGFVETGHSQPSRLAAGDRARVVDAALRGVQALGIVWSAAHAEVKLCPDGPYLMEIGARLGGDFITTELVPRSTGIDMVRAAIQLALGRRPDLAPQHPPAGAAIRYLLPEPGTVTAVTGSETSQKMPGVVAIHVDVRAGDTVPEVTSSLSRVGHVITEGRDAAEAVERAEAARAAIRIATTPAPAERR